MRGVSCEVIVVKVSIKGRVLGQELGASCPAIR